MDMMSLRRRVMVNQNRLVTATGNPLTFNTPLTKPLKECVVRFTPKQSGSGTPSPENVRPIVGKNGITVWQSGKNLFDYTDGENIRIATSATDRKKTASSYGTITNDGNTVTLTRTLEAAGLVFILGELQAGFTYTLSGTWDNIDNKAYIALLDTDVTDEYTSTRKYTISFYYNSVSFTPEVTGIYEVLLWRGGRGAISASNVQLEYGSTATAYESFTASIETSVSFDDVPQDIDSSEVAGTIYGGYVDISKGVLVAEWAEIASYSGETLTDEWLSDRDVYSASGTPTTGAQVVYKLAEPIHYPLSPRTLTTLQGNNVMWSDANGDITVRYWTR